MIPFKWNVHSYSYSNETKMFKSNEKSSIFTAKLPAIREVIRLCPSLEKNKVCSKICSICSSNTLLIDLLILCFQITTANKNGAW